MSKCYDNPDYDDLGSDIQNTWEQHVELINDNIEEFDKAIKLFKQETLEEASKNYVDYCACNISEDEDLADADKRGFIYGAKWQQEKDNKELLFFGEWIFDQFNLNIDIPVSKIIKEYLTIKKL